MLKKIILSGFILSVIFAGGLFFVPNAKYHLKKLVKSNDFLYRSTRKALEFKQKHFARNGATRVKDQPNFKRTSWQVVFDASKVQGVCRNYWGNLGFESFKSGILSRETRLLLDEMRTTRSLTGAETFSEQPFRFIRAHNLFSDGQPPWGEGCDIYHEDESGRVSYNWKIVDDVFDRVIENDLKPIIEFGFMPDALASMPDRRQRWGKANISPPKDYTKWRDLVYETVMHFCSRYGTEEVANWYFEVWNEPDLGWVFWIEDPDPNRKPYGDLKAYHKLYDYSLVGARLAFPGIRIGGPASAGGDIELLLEHILLGERFLDSEVPNSIDFVSTHTYGPVGHNWNNRKEKSILRSIKWKLDRALHHDHESIRNKAREIPFLLTEVGPAGDNFAYFNTRFVAAWLVKLVHGVNTLGEVEDPVYIPREMVYWSGEQVVRRFDNRKGVAASIKLNGENVIIKRPVYNAFEALGYLRGHYIEPVEGFRFGDRVGGLATSDEERVAVILYNLDEKDRYNSSDDSVTVNLRVKNLPFETYTVDWFVIDQKHSNGFRAWEEMGQPKRLTSEQYLKLNARDDLQRREPRRDERSQDHVFEANIAMQSNSVSLFVLSKRH